MKVGRDPAGLLVGFCVLIWLLNSCGACWNIVYTQPFCDPSRPECVDGGDE